MGRGCRQKEALGTEGRKRLSERTVGWVRTTVVFFLALLWEARGGKIMPKWKGVVLHPAGKGEKLKRGVRGRLCWVGKGRNKNALMYREQGHQWEWGKVKGRQAEKEIPQRQHWCFRSMQTLVGSEGYVTCGAQPWQTPCKIVIEERAWAGRLNALNKSKMSKNEKKWQGQFNQVSGTHKSRDGRKRYKRRGKK